MPQWSAVLKETRVGTKLTPPGIYTSGLDLSFRTVLPASAEYRRSIMNGLIVFLALVGAAMAQYGHPGVQETPEVAAARAAHLSALAAAGGHVPAAAPSYGAPAAPGVPADTPEVAAAKAAHFAALAKVGGSPQGAYDTGAYNPSYDNSGAYNPSYDNSGAYNPTPSYNSGSWQGPQALPPGFDANGAPLPVQDTPEVQAERAKHFALAAGHGAPAPAWNAAPAPAWNAPAPSWNAPAPSWNAAPAPAWNAPAPAWNAAPSGLPADTPEVAAAKAAHLAAHQAAGHRYKRSLVAAHPIFSHSIAYTAPVAVAPIAPLHVPVLRHSYLL
ncbi:pupal cuticle protein [Halyomorpha halys]|uniref:pupal cuticle protein n=1 Tax=Halyomorpha halys TaxID=286706 RepID=UPI0006D4DD11|nr:pupal cuticle protein-like [Halyomorpha halys]